MPSRDRTAARHAEAAPFREAGQQRPRRRPLDRTSTTVAAVIGVAAGATAPAGSATAADEPGSPPAPLPASGTTMLESSHRHIAIACDPAGRRVRPSSPSPFAVGA